MQQSKLDKASIDQLSKAAIDERVKQMEVEAAFLPKIPTRFNIKNGDLMRINGQKYAVKHFAAQIESGLIKYDGKKLTAESQEG